MKPEYEKISRTPELSFIAKVVRRENRPLLTQAWHFHPEIEICFTRQSQGRRYTGNRINDYREGDLVMFGSLLPHGYTTIHQSEQVVIQLTRNFLGEDFFDKPEMRPLSDLLEKATMGLEFFGETHRQATALIEQLMAAEGTEKLLYLLKLLSTLAESEEVNTICSKDYSATLNMDQLSRIKRVFDYIEANFTQDISISEVARSVNLSEPAFYKFIRRHTKQKFTHIINQYRIFHATELLINTEKTIAEVCYECGYNNVSYFNRKFREIMDETPRDFKKKYV